MTDDELESARDWIKSREGKPASRGMILAIRLLATLDAERAEIERLRTALEPLFSPHGPTFGSPAWQEAWRRAEAALPAPSEPVKADPFCDYCGTVGHRDEEHEE